MKDQKPTRCNCLFHRHENLVVFRGEISTGTAAQVVSAIKRNHPRSAELGPILLVPSKFYVHGMTADELLGAAREAGHEPVEA